LRGQREVQVVRLLRDGGIPVILTQETIDKGPNSKTPITSAGYGHAQDYAANGVGRLVKPIPAIIFNRLGCCSPMIIDSLTPHNHINGCITGIEQASF
jgi:hypothetical protein